MSCVGLAISLLSGCITPNFEDAQPEKYAGLDCEQLDQLAESFRPNAQDILLQDDPSELERRNARRNISPIANQRAGDVPTNAKAERDRRSLALARRQKGCI